MRILLIEPAKPARSVGGEDAFLFEPLALEYVAAGVRDRHDVRILDMRLHGDLPGVLAEYRPHEHPVVGPLLAGGPAALAQKYGLPAGDEYVDHCHLCFLVRRNIVDDLPQYLCPKDTYGDPK